MLNEAFVGTHWTALPTPCLVIDMEALDHNISTMASFAAKAGRALRPHVKSHRCGRIAQLQLSAGAVGVTCAKMGEAEAMAEAGVKSILIANQIVAPGKIKALAGLNRYCEAMPAVSSSENAEDISREAVAFGVQIPVFIEIDAGINRSGVREAGAAAKLAERICALPGISLKGIMAYEARGLTGDFDHRQRVAHSQKMLEEALKGVELIEKNICPVEILSCASTGTAKYTSQISRVSELQPGSYVFGERAYDIGDIGLPLKQALFVIAGVTFALGGRMILNSGRKSIGIDQGPPALAGSPSVEVECHEEHAVLDLPQGYPPYKPGDVLELVPGHCCTTANLHDHYFCLRGGVVEAVWSVNGRGRSY